MSSNYEDSDSEVHGINKHRPPSSYGSMHSDDDEEEEEFPHTPTRLRLHRSYSPGSSVTVQTRQYQLDESQSGVFLEQQTIVHLEQPPATAPIRESFSLNKTELPSYRGDDDLQEHCEAASALELQDEDVALPEEDLDEIVLPYQKPKDPAPLPPEGSGLQFQHPHPSLSLGHVLSAMVNVLSQLVFLDAFKNSLSFENGYSKEFPQIYDLQDPLDLVDKMIELRGKGKALSVTFQSLEFIGRGDLAKILRKTCRRAFLQYDLKAHHWRRYYSLYEGRCRPGQQRYISEVYVETLTVIRGNREPVNLANEVQQIPYTIEEIVIRPADIFRPLPDDPKPVRTIMMTGVPACGLTVTVNKFIIDWTEEKANQDFQFVFPLPVREMNLREEKEMCFLKAITYFLPDSDDIQFIEKDDCLSLFIIDALELSRFPLDFDNNPTVTSTKEAALLDVLLTSLIKGSLLPHARIWITSHVSASYRIPLLFIDRFVELRGFTDEKKEEYFTKRTPQPELGRQVFHQMKRSKDLEIICHLPLFSWIVAFLFERAFERDPEYGSQPPGITTFYSQYLIVQMNRSFEKYRGCSIEDMRWTEDDVKFTEKLGKMAFGMLQEGRDWFKVEHLAAVNLQYEDLRTRDGLTSEVKRSSDDKQTWVFRFVHVTIQEYIAAMYAYVSFRKYGKNVMESSKIRFPGLISKDHSVVELYRSAIDRALASSDGHWDMFVRFLVGLLTPGTEAHLRGFQLDHNYPKVKGTEEVIKYIQKKMNENILPERHHNLQLCLVELEQGKEEVRR
ncbi:hypothetical protein DNTS_009555 [Danionella cerebrum]|uniref:NACHT domain-containing protein n=1 Tax=Danionella cerebrum TaxID=2873325 RepID=A0A553N125_9TELE|nr:hypothetical protein DNTS_009555 [Danionella translucida]